MVNIKYEKKSTLKDIKELRDQYLDRLIEPQELYLELFCRKSEIYLIEFNNETIGYFILGDDNILFEYYIIENRINNIDEIFQKIVTKFLIKKAYCKSFDHNLMSCCLGIQTKTKVLGVLFREYKEIKIEINDKNLKARFADKPDLAHISEINEEVFNEDEEIEYVIGNKNMIIFENSTEIVGFGIFQRNIEGRPEFDIGMLVDKKYRGQGYGKYIINYLVKYCKENGWRGICGCAFENIASRKCLESAGYIGRYRVLEFTF